jgi:thiol:disulfide interchange protein
MGLFTVVFITLAICLTIVALVNRNRRRYILSTIILIVLILLWFGEAALFDFYVNPRKAKAQNSVYAPDGVLRPYIAPNGKFYPTEGDYKKTLR